MIVGVVPFRFDVDGPLSRRRDGEPASCLVEIAGVAVLVRAAPGDEDVRHEQRPRRHTDPDPGPGRQRGRRDERFDDPAQQQHDDQTQRDTDRALIARTRAEAASLARAAGWL